MQRGAEHVTVEPARESDVMPVFRIETATFADPWSYGAFRQFLGADGFLVARDADAARPVVGFVIGTPVSCHGQPTGHIKNLAVRPDRREEGIGTALLEAAIDVLLSAGAETVTLEVRRENTAARSLYRSLGFEHLRTVEGYYGDGEDALVLVLRVDAASQGV